MCFNVAHGIRHRGGLVAAVAVDRGGRMPVSRRSSGALA